MRFATRTFLWFFIPVALLLTGSFGALQRVVVSSVRQGLGSSLRENQVSIARMASKHQDRNARILRVVGESAALKAGLQLVRAEPLNPEARLTVEDQLRDICGTLGCDFMLMSSPGGAPFAGVIRADEWVKVMDVSTVRPPRRGFFWVAENTYHVTSVPIDQGDENIGILYIGERFDASDFSTPIVLAHNSEIVTSGLPGIAREEIAAAIRKCGIRRECATSLKHETYLAIKMDESYVGDGYSLHSFQSIDAAVAPVRAVLRHVFLIAAMGGMGAALALGALSSRSVTKPLASLIAHLRQSEKTGMLPEFGEQPSTIHEIRELTDSFKGAASAILEGREKLDLAYVEFIGSLASALDARDPYTAGHSRRVSEFSCSIASAVDLPRKELEEIRIGALLHDIGKIGIADAVLQKPGRLTSAEFDIIKQHPEIGCRILEGVNGLQQYLPIVGLHHENWDGSGYPQGQRGAETPFGARVVHVADAYDAMTSDRPYRAGLDPQKAIRELERCAGTQFDATIVGVFVEILTQSRKGAPNDYEASLSISKLAEAVCDVKAPRARTLERIIS
jgi:HD-GYP domain-containing protein (c-di-GMP phosphodiesterase class II)